MGSRSGFTLISTIIGMSLASVTLLSLTSGFENAEKVSKTYSVQQESQLLTSEIRMALGGRLCDCMLGDGQTAFSSSSSTQVIQQWRYDPTQPPGSHCQLAINQAIVAENSKSGSYEVRRVRLEDFINQGSFGSNDLWRANLNVELEVPTVSQGTNVVARVLGSSKKKISIPISLLENKSVTPSRFGSCSAESSVSDLINQRANKTTVLVNNGNILPCEPNTVGCQYPLLVGTLYGVPRATIPRLNVPPWSVQVPNTSQVTIPANRCRDSIELRVEAQAQHYGANDNGSFQIGVKVNGQPISNAGPWTAHNGLICNSGGGGCTSFAAYRDPPHKVVIRSFRPGSHDLLSAQRSFFITNTQVRNTISFDLDYYYFWPSRAAFTVICHGDTQ